MIKFLPTPTAKGYFLFISVFLILTDLVILLDVPIFRQILGFLFFTIVPGFLVLHILKLNKLRLAEKIVLSVGLSISFLMFFGLLINLVYPLFGYTTPLSTISLVISFSVILLILAIIAYLKNRTTFFASLSDSKLNNKEKTFLLLPAFFPLLSILGIHIMNTTNNNATLMALLFLIPAYATLVTVKHRQVSERVYPPIIFLISISLLLIWTLSSNHVISVDSQYEYYVFQETFGSQRWQTSGSILDACLSISLLPSIYQSFMNINSEYLFKLLYPLIFSVSPLVVYIISKKYIGSLYAFLSSLFFISQNMFLFTTVVSRTNTAILFFALVVMILFHDYISDLAKRILFVIFTASCIVSHYSTTYVFFFVLFFTWIGTETIPIIVLRRAKPLFFLPRNSIGENNSIGSLQNCGILRGNVNTSRISFCSIFQPSLKKRITITVIVLFSVMLFLWHSQIIETSFGCGLHLIQKSLINLNHFFSLESRGPIVMQALGKGVTVIQEKISFGFNWLTIAFITIGVLSTMVRYRRMVYSPNSGWNKLDFLQSKFDSEYFIISLACCTTLVFSLVFPYILVGYAANRLYFQAVTVLSAFFCVGGITVAKWLKTRPYWIILVVLIFYFICTTGIIYQITGSTESVILNSNAPLRDWYYIHDQEIYSARWLRDNSDSENIKIYTDTDGGGILVSQALISPRLFDNHSLFKEGVEVKGYIYLRYYNVIHGELLGPGGHRKIDLMEYQDKFEGKNKIYQNGGSEIWE